MNILGLNILNHDTSATLLVNGEIIGMAEEERFTRKKHEKRFPINSIKFLLKRKKINSKKIDAITIPYHPWAGIFHLFKYCSFNFIKYSFFFLKSLIRELTFKKRIKKLILENFSKENLELNKNCKFFFFEHHLCHAASAYYASPFKKSAILSWDGRGQWAWLLQGIGVGNEIKIQKREYIPNSLGQLYESFTHLLGFGDYGDEYKVMGLSSYGKDTYSNIFNKIVKIENNKVKITPSLWKFDITASKRKKLFKINLDNFSNFLKKKNNISSDHKNIAHSLQKKVSDIGLLIADNLYKENKIKNLCIAGGIAQNILINQKIFLYSNFKNIYVQPASHDGGLSLGGALLALNFKKKKKEKRIFMDHTYWGSEFKNKEIFNELKNHKIVFKKIKNISKKTAKILANGKIIGWFQGRSEFGPRALGNRSILADPRKKNMQEKVNKIIKFREVFRPFAPSVLEEDYEKFFYNSPPNQFMTFSANVKKRKKDIIPSVTHVDNTARPQTVYKKKSKKFWQLLKEFKKITGIGVLLNTSFNVKGEPIVDSPKDAINCFLLSGLDHLIIGDYLVSKK